MSHFTVLVIGDDPETQLAPYQENNMGDCPPEYLKFHDRTDEVESDWEELGEEEQRKKYEGSIVDFADAYHGYKPHTIDGKRRFGYYENPNRKWDWYELGGRWTGFFPLLEGADPATFKIGRPGIMTSPAKRGYADSAQIKSIDFAKARDEVEHEVRQRYEVFRALADRVGHGVDAETGKLTGADLPRTWAEIRDSFGENYGEHINEARSLYRNQPIVDLAHKMRKELDKSHPHRRWIDSFIFSLYGDFLKDMQKPEEEAVIEARNSALSTYAILYNGEWYGRGEMGWFGMSSNEVSDAEWQAKRSALLDNLDPETWLHVYDCHI